MCRPQEFGMSATVTEGTKIKLSIGTWVTIVGLLLVHTVGVTTYFERRFSAIEKNAEITAVRINGHETDMDALKASMSRERAEVLTEIRSVGNAIYMRLERTENKLDRVAEDVARQSGVKHP
jgi:hypothetical protein